MAGGAGGAGLDAAFPLVFSAPLDSMPGSVAFFLTSSPQPESTNAIALKQRQAIPLKRRIETILL
jgi:hypothetical protein